MRRFPALLRLAVPAAALLLSAAALAAPASRLPEGLAVTRVAESLVVDGIPTSLWRFSGDEDPDALAHRLRRQWRADSNEQLFEQRMADGLAISQKVGEYWYTAKLKRTSFNRVEGTLAATTVFREGKPAKTPLPFELPAGMRVAQHTRSFDHGLTGDLWLLEGGQSVQSSAARIEAGIKRLGGVRDPQVRYPGSPQQAYAAMFTSGDSQWSVTVERRSEGTFAVLNRIQRKD